VEVPPELLVALARLARHFQRRRTHSESGRCPLLSCCNRDNTITTGDELKS
jgi:hypothetical protein